MNWITTLRFLAFFSAINFLITVNGVNGKTGCNNDEECIARYTPNFEVAQEYNSSLVKAPYCSITDFNGSNSNTNVGFCTCGEFCKSRSTSRKDNTVFYYCGPCGRVGSECKNSTVCDHEMSQCINGYCDCRGGGIFYDLYYCYIPYHGYEVALQLAVATCIIIAVCLILVSIYNAVGVRRLRRIQTLRNLLRRDNGNRRTRPEDAPPKYDDVVEDLPTYQDALRMNQDLTDEKGISNPTFESDEHDSNDSELNIKTSTEVPFEETDVKKEDRLPDTKRFSSTDCQDVENEDLKLEVNKENKEDEQNLNRSLSFKGSNGAESFCS